MTENFLKIIDFTLQWEGGYSNHPNDPGGETKYGITKRNYPNLDIKNLTLDMAKGIYFKDYWSKPFPLERLPLMHSAVIFDTNVNTGAKRTTKIIQEALNDLDINIQVDGAFGPQTENALYTGCQLPNLAFVMCEKRADFYNRLISSKPDLAVFLDGWMNRVQSLQEFITTL